MKDFSKDNDLIRLERIDYTDQVLDAVSNWKRNPQLIDLEKYNKYKEIIMSKIKDKTIPYTTEIERITIDTNSQGKKEEEFILSLEFDDIYLNFIEDVFFTNECSSLHYNIDPDINELCEIWGERPLKLKELFYNKKKEQIEQNGEINKEKEFEKTFQYIVRDLIRKNKFSIAKSELGKIIHDAKINNLSGTLDQARNLLRFCNIKERELENEIEEEFRINFETYKIAQKRREEEEAEATLNNQKQLEIREELSKARSLIIQKKIIEGKKLLDNVIKEANSLSESVSSSIFSQASEMLDYCDDFMQNKKELSNIEDLIKGKKYSIAATRLKDLIDEIESYIGDKMLINNEILTEASILFKKHRIYAPEESISEDSISEDSLSEEEQDEINEINKEIMFDKKLERIGKQTQKFSYDIPVENLFNLLLDFMKILPDPTATKIEDSNDEYTLQTTWGILHFKIIERLPFEKLIYEYDFLKSNWGEKGKLHLDFLEPNLGKATIHIRNEITEVAKHHKEKLIIHNVIGTCLKLFIDMNLGKIVAKQIHTIIYEKNFDDLTMRNSRILQAKLNAMGKDINNLKQKFYEVKAPLTLTSFNCSECSATLNITSKEEKFIICEHCDTSFLMEWQQE